MLSSVKKVNKVSRLLLTRIWSEEDLENDQYKLVQAGNTMLGIILENHQKATVCEH